MYINININIRWLGEKYDGVRCYWNPKRSQLYLSNRLPSIFYYPSSSSSSSFSCSLFILFSSPSPSFSLIFIRYSRMGLPLPVPPQLTKLMCPVFVDAELWYEGRVEEEGEEREMRGRREREEVDFRV